MSTADIDRLAKAVIDEFVPEHGRLIRPDPNTGLFYFAGHVDPDEIVRAVLQALREPTPDAQTAVLDDFFEGETYTTLYRDDCERGLPFFIAMIDKLLEE